MKKVVPQVFLVGETKVVPEGLAAYLKHVGVPDWSTNAPSDSELLAEVMGRICYKSFAPGLNPNVTKIREGNDTYLLNILGQLHGSVIEHPQVNFIFADVSRVFTHELVRHRVGVGISQESLRYVRLDSLSASIPIVIQESPEAMEIFMVTIEFLEEQQRKLAQVYELDKPGTDFHKKKRVTSAMRRIAPIGLATQIGWSANFRTLRWVIENRTGPGAEEEIRQVFGMVAEQVISRYPNVFGDFEPKMVDGQLWYKPKFSKV